MELLDYDFMRRAVVAAVLVGLAAPAVGVFLVQRRLTLIGDGLGHVAVAGVALGLVLGGAPLLAAAAVTVAAAVAVVAAHPGWVVWLVAVTVAVALLTVVGAIALVGGYHSTRMSRLADRVEALAVVLVLPFGVVAAGGIEALRRLTSG